MADLTISDPPMEERVVLDCESCGVKSTERASRWRAFLGSEDDDSSSVVVMCPSCAVEVDDA